MVSDKIKYIREYITKEDKIFTDRVNLFFLSQSMLFLSYVTSLYVGIIYKNNNSFNSFLIYNISLILNILGIFASMIFLLVLRKQVANIHLVKEILSNKEKGIDKISQELKEIREKRFGSTNVSFGHLIPLSFLFTWCTLFIFSFETLNLGIFYLTLIIGIFILIYFGWQLYILDDKDSK